jgi:hypothetical protein
VVSSAVCCSFSKAGERNPLQKAKGTKLEYRLSLVGSYHDLLRIDKVILYTDICGSQRFTAPETRRFNDKLLNLGIVLYYLVIFYLFIYLYGCQSTTTKCIGN